MVCKTRAYRKTLKCEGKTQLILLSPFTRANRKTLKCEGKTQPARLTYHETPSIRSLIGAGVRNRFLGWDGSVVAWTQGDHRSRNSLLESKKRPHRSP
jgi:hypothetical protein